MACVSKFDLLLEEYGLEKYVGLATHNRYVVCRTSECYYRHFLGYLTVDKLDRMTDAELEEFVVECAMLSM